MSTTATTVEQRLHAFIAYHQRERVARARGRTGRFVVAEREVGYENAIADVLFYVVGDEPLPPED